MSSNNSKKNRVLKKKISLKSFAFSLVLIAGVGLAIFLIFNFSIQEDQQEPVESVFSQTNEFSNDQDFENLGADTEAFRFNISEFEDGTAKYFTYEGFEKPVHFFLVKAEDGIVRAAFDACDVCYRSKKGYSQEGDYMVCNNCGQIFHISKINEIKGGCNPSPLERVFDSNDGTSLTISTNALREGLRYF